MDLSKVKLVVSDMDGTLLNSKDQVSDRFLKVFKKLQENNIQFIAASGRQYNSIAEKLSSIKDAIYIIAENGAVGKHKDKLLFLKALSKNKITEIITTLRKVKNSYTILCTEKIAFIETKDQNFLKLFNEFYTSYKVVDDLTSLIDTCEILKIAIYHNKSSEKYIYPHLESLKDDVLIKISGKNWLDISDIKANKGVALKEIQQLLKITKNETLVFGDYHNDIEMLEEATYSYAMGNAHPEIKKIAQFETDSNDNFGVEKVLEQLIKNYNH